MDVTVETAVAKAEQIEEELRRETQRLIDKHVDGFNDSSGPDDGMMKEYQLQLSQVRDTFEELACAIARLVQAPDKLLKLGLATLDLSERAEMLRTAEWPLGRPNDEERYERMSNLLYRANAFLHRCLLHFRLAGSQIVRGHLDWRPTGQRD